MHVTIVTAFPEFFGDFLSTSIVGRAVRKGLVRVDVVDLRSFGRGGYRQIDDYAFGSGGMVLAAPQLLDALNEARSRGSGRGFTVYPSPQGPLLSQEMVETLSRQEHVILLCGHYEGMDERFVRREVDLEVTVGDCVLTGGEIPAMAVVDAMSRLVPGVVGRGEAVAEDSFYRGMLDHPHYTRPANWEGLSVPEVLLSGDEAGIRSWRRAEAVRRTLSRRSDLLPRAAIGDYLSGVCAAVVSHGSPTEETVRGVCALCRMYGLGRPFWVFPDPESRRDFSRELREYGELDPAPKVLGSLARVREALPGSPLIVETLSRPREGAFHSLEAKRRCLEHGGPVLLLFPDGADAVGLDGDEALFTFLAEEGAEGLPLAARMAVALDRLLGKR
ncbi:MAG: tRNA (guanosine(37)-N1)-methyltransferase TrmD [Synergistaceae bacterium]|nr:tRNA (guanosine(37)-N1)-methyltransferase TrmD [Synergistaceae bacterium]